jgi:hypothetical protein
LCFILRRRQRKQQRQADLLTQSESSNSGAPETGPFQVLSISWTLMAQCWQRCRLPIRCRRNCMTNI